jgi:transcriptional regulator with XRE-family HTH domain
LSTLFLLLTIIFMCDNLKAKEVAELSIGERIRYLRKELLDETQEEFSRTIKVSRGNLGNIETSKVKATDRIISDICQAKNVNENWLRTGEGEIFVPAAHGSNQLSALAQEYSLSPADCIAVEKFIKLTPGSRQAVLDYMADVTHGISALRTPDRLEVSAELAPQPSLYRPAAAEADYEKSLGIVRSTGSTASNTTGEERLKEA